MSGVGGIGAGGGAAPTQGVAPTASTGKSGDNHQHGQHNHAKIESKAVKLEIDMMLFLLLMKLLEHGGASSQSACGAYQATQNLNSGSQSSTTVTA